MTATTQRPSRFASFLASAACFVGVALAGLLPVTAAHAEDGKVYSALVCQPFGSSAQPYRYVFGIKNTTANTMVVECPGIRDEVYSNYGLNSTVVTFEKPANTTVSCNLFSYSKDSVSAVYATKSDTASAGGKRSIVFGYLGGYASGFYGLQCYLPPGATMHSFQLNEYQP